MFGHGLKLTKGGISALPEAATRNMLTLDVKINPGNSGGPLCDSRGNVIGIVSARTAFAGNFGAPIESYGLAVGSQDIVTFLKANQVMFLAKEPAQTALTWNEIDRHVSPAVAMVIKAPPMTPVTKELALSSGTVTELSKIDNADGRDPANRQSFAKVFTVKLEKGKTYQIDMTSKELDSFVRIENANRQQLAQDDNSGGDRDARILVQCPAEGMYVIVATTFGVGMGNFTLKVTEVSTAK
jgi:serine protease Do